MNTSVQNNNFNLPVDGWYHIEAKGTFFNASGIKELIDDAACNSIVANFNGQADQPGFPGMLIDHEHFKHDITKETIAYGWLTRLEAREDGLYGQIRWTGTGETAVKNGDYRFFSTEYASDNMELVSQDGQIKTLRPLVLDGLTLTNMPNNSGQHPITNRGIGIQKSVSSLSMMEAAQQYQSTHGCSFERAWNAMREQRLMEALPQNDPRVISFNRRQIIQDYQVKNRCSHEIALHAIQRKYPELFTDR